MLCTGEHVLDAIPAEPGVAERGVLPLLLLPPPPPPLIQASQAGGEDRQVDDFKKYLFEKNFKFVSNIVFRILSG